MLSPQAAGDAPSARTSTTAAAIGAGALAVAAGVATIALVIVNGGSPASTGDLPLSIVAVSFGLVGMLVASRQPRNATGWLFLFVAVVIGLSGVTDEYSLLALITHPSSLPGAVWAEWLSTWWQTLLFPGGAIALLMLVIPDGHLPSRRWKPVAVAALILTTIGVLAGMFAPGQLTTGGAQLPSLLNPIGLPVSGPIGAVLSFLGLAWLPGFVVFAAAAAAPLVRLRRSRGDERHEAPRVS